MRKLTDKFSKSRPLFLDPLKSIHQSIAFSFLTRVCTLCAVGEVAGAHGDERDAADGRAEAAPQAGARQGVLSPRRRKVSSSPGLYFGSAGLVFGRIRILKNFLGNAD